MVYAKEWNGCVIRNAYFIHLFIYLFIWLAKHPVYSVNKVQKCTDTHRWAPCVEHFTAMDVSERPWLPTWLTGGRNGCLGPFSSQARASALVFKDKWHLCLAISLPLSSSTMARANSKEVPGPQLVRM
jgi:hypothetical protein